MDDFKLTRRSVLHIACLGAVGLAIHFASLRILGGTWTSFAAAIAADWVVLQLYRSKWGDSVLPDRPLGQQARSLVAGIIPCVPMLLLVFYSPWGRAGTTLAMTVYGVLLLAAIGVVLWRWRDEFDAWLRGR